MTVRRVNLPAPPNPMEARFLGQDGPQAYMMSAYNWMLQVKSAVENYSRLQSLPAGQQLQSSSYTLTTAITGASTGTDIANFVCTFVKALQDKGVLSPVATR